MRIEMLVLAGMQLAGVSTKFEGMSIHSLYEKLKQKFTQQNRGNSKRLENSRVFMEVQRKTGINI